LTIDFDTVTFDDVTVDFGRRRALNRVGATFRAGEVVAVLGPNGAGKTTLLFVAATLLRPSTGEIRFGKWPREAAGVRRRIGVVGHDLYVYSELSAEENLRFFARLYHVADAEACVHAALQQADLARRAGEPIGAFSRGMRQRLAIERALIHNPRLVLLDEPFTGLDEPSSATLKSRLSTLRQRGCIVIVTTHDIEAVDGLCDRGVLLHHGRLSDIEAGPGTLRERYRRAMAVETAGNLSAER
jgi:heme ABC exporter ATP-binding subunit CcmA